MANLPFRHTRRVQYADCTVGNHVYHARYLEWLDQARGEFFRSLGLPLLGLQEAGTIFVLVEYQIAYRAPARYDDALAIEVEPVELRRARLRLRYRVLNSRAESLLEATATYASTNPGGRPIRMPAALAAALQPWLGPAGSV